MSKLRYALKGVLQPITPFTRAAEVRLVRFNDSFQTPSPVPADREMRSIEDIKSAGLQFAESLRVVDDHGSFLGYRHSPSTKMPILYSTLAVLLLKHLYGVSDSTTSEELERVLTYQNEDGLFRDPAIDCQAAADEDWWGWRHLTLHALMTLALYDVAVKYKMTYIEQLLVKDNLRIHLERMDWGSRVGVTSNAVQNLGVMLQYARDWQGLKEADSALEIIYNVIERNQDPSSGLHGIDLDTLHGRSFGVRATYHFWLLYCYDRRPMPMMDKIVINALNTQNMRGGFSPLWNSNACEDIDSIDGIARFSPDLGNNYKETAKLSLLRTISPILSNVNPDGGWVFRRDEPLFLPHPQMCSSANESNLFYTWFRTLGLAYCLQGLGELCPPELRYDWQWGWVPGHHLPINPNCTQS